MKMKLLIIAALIIYHVTALPISSGDVSKIDTSGASEQTAHQDKLTEKALSSKKRPCPCKPPKKDTLTTHPVTALSSKKRPCPCKHHKKALSSKKRPCPCKPPKKGTLTTYPVTPLSSSFGDVSTIDTTVPSTQTDTLTTRPVTALSSTQTPCPSKNTKNAQSSGFGDVSKIHTTGASEKTARQDKLHVKGVKASYKLAEEDLKRLEKYKKIILKVGKATGIDPALIAAIISRESRAGLALNKKGFGDHGHGFGLMQIDIRYHKKLKGKWNSEEHIAQATDILIKMIRQIQKKHPCWTLEQQLKAGIAAYNGKKKSDYADDVVARAQWFKRHGYN